MAMHIQRTKCFSNLGMLKGEHQIFQIFYDLNIITKSKTDSEFSLVS